MTTIVYKYQIPDLPEAMPEEQRGMAPSAELIDFIPKPAQKIEVVGKTVSEISKGVGTYGMGGPGFFGLKLDEDWLVIAIWGASEWMSAKGRNVGDSYHDNYGRQLPWMADWLPDQQADALSRNLVGIKVAGFDVQKHSLKIDFENGFDLTIQEDHSLRPILEGNKQPRVFAPDDDLRKAVFFSPTTEIWV